LRSKCKNRDSAERKGGRCGVWQMQTRNVDIRRVGAGVDRRGEKIFAVGI